MCIWNKILVGLICLAAPFLFYMSARMLKTDQNWSGEAARLTEDLKKANTEHEQLMEGVEKPDGTVEPGLRQLRIELHRLLVDRRRAWANCIPSIKLGSDTAEVTLTIDAPAPHGIADKTVLYAFEEPKKEEPGAKQKGEKPEKPEKGRYLGEFAVTKQSGKQITIVPTKRLTPRERDKLAQAEKDKNAWRLYELMPQDKRYIFAALTDEQKRSLLPAASVDEYIKDGKPASPDDVADRVVDGKYVRQLHDYNILFNSEYEQETLLRDSIEAATRDKKLMDDALALGRQQEEACKKDIASATEDRAKDYRERDVVAAQLKILQEKVAAMQAAVARLIEWNRAMAGQIAKFQLEAARRIDRRTQAMARSDSGRP